MHMLSFAAQLRQVLVKFNAPNLEDLWLQIRKHERALHNVVLEGVSCMSQGDTSLEELLEEGCLYGLVPLLLQRLVSTRETNTVPDYSTQINPRTGTAIAGDA